jgi:biopolymer transport protein ExbD
MTMNMTPMIDIVFLLLIFFMAVTQVSEINNEPLNLPSLKGGEDQIPSTITVNVEASGRIIVSGYPCSAAELVSIAADEIAALGDDPLRLTVVLRVHRRGASRTVNQIVTALGNLGVSKVRIAVVTDQS